MDFFSVVYKCSMATARKFVSPVGYGWTITIHVKNTEIWKLLEKGKVY